MIQIERKTRVLSYSLADADDDGDGQGCLFHCCAAFRRINVNTGFNGDVGGIFNYMCKKHK